MPLHYPQEPNHPTDLSMPPPPDKIIHIDTAPVPSSSSSHTHHPDVAGVLRRNQACLQCRKRKLARPHCATCVRSYRHLLRTSPKSNPVLCCDYDEGTGSHHEEGHKGEKGTSSQSPARNQNQGPEDDDGGGKKKRKAAGEGKRKKKDEEFEEERDRLTKQIEELQAQLKQNLNPTSQKQKQAASSTLNQNPSLQETLSAQSAPSPTAFLEMLSSAASNQVPNASTSNNTGKSSGQTASGSTPFWLGQMDQGSVDAPSGFRPMFMFDQSGHQSDASVIRGDPSPDAQSQESRRSSLLTPGGGHSSPQSQNILSPGGIFNFSPGPSTNLMSNWPPPPDPITGNIEPSTKVDGPWRAVETIETVYAASMINNQNQNQDQQSFSLDTNMETEINLDGLQAGLDAAMQQQLLMDLFWPGWPINLPEPNVVNDLIEAFFDLVPNLPRVLHRARFLSRMALPPTHSNFPHPALIHAVCAAAAAWCSPEIYEKSTRGKGRDFFDSNAGAGMYGNDVLEGKGSKANLTFGLRQASFAKEAVQEGLNTGNRLFDVVRAMIILCRVFIDDTRMLECWAYGGLVARMLLPLGLNVRSAELSLKSVMLPPPADALEREERRAAVWMAFYHDTIASSASGWGTSMSLDELTVPLPVSFKDFEIGHEQMEPNPQDLESPDFWVKHPVPDSFVMVIKATVLMNRTNKFARRWKNRHMRDNDDFDGLYKPEFREIANAIACFQMSFPPAMRNVGKLTSKRKLDIDLIAAQMLPHAAIICLHEPFADLNDPSDQAARRMLGATQAIVSIVQQLASVFGEGGTNFTSVMHSSASVCLVTSARTSLLFLRHALNIGDMAAAQSHRTDCEMIRMALSQFGLKFKIGHHHSQLIEYFLDRATNPTFEKLQAHYPDHPRSGAPELTPTANFGLCVSNALNIKRGFWRLPKQSTSTGASPFGSTPESVASGSHASRPHASSSSSVSQHLSDHDSPKHPLETLGLRGQTQPSLHRNASGTEAMDTDPVDQFKDFTPCVPARPSATTAKSDQQSTLSETGLCDMAPPPSGKNTFHKADGRSASLDSNNNSGGSGPGSGAAFDISLPGITPVTQEMMDKIASRGVLSADGQYPVWMNTSENELLAEAQAHMVLQQQQQPLGGSESRLNKEMEAIYSTISKPGMGPGGIMPFLSDALVESIESQKRQQQQQSGSGLGSGNRSAAQAGLSTSGLGGGIGGMGQTLSPEIENKFGNIQTIGQDGHLHVIHNMTQEQLMAEINKDGGLPRDGQVGYKEGEKEFGRVGEMLRGIYQ
ncbi:uncharacterized protein L199_008427 [Kwoniella botswanensis]|uniref:uncharacterized protein n=1 Tax=Kwoniella botswanensis TaxID=1268659 RepID=UPI00315C8AE4